MKRQKIKTLEEAFFVVDQLVENYDEGTKERKMNSDKLKEKTTKEEYFHYRLMVAAATQTDGKKKKNEPVVGVMQILGDAVATDAIPRVDIDSNKLEYVSMKFGPRGLH